MIVTFATNRGKLMFDNIENVEWTQEIDNCDPNSNIIETKYDPLQSVNWQRIYGATLDTMSQRIIGENGASPKSAKYLCSVDDKILSPEAVVDGDPKRGGLLVIMATHYGKLKLIYTELDVFLMNDSGKTVERL